MAQTRVRVHQGSCWASAPCAGDAGAGAPAGGGSRAIDRVLREVIGLRTIPVGRCNRIAWRTRRVRTARRAASQPGAAPVPHARTAGPLPLRDPAARPRGTRPLHCASVGYRRVRGDVRPSRERGRVSHGSRWARDRGVCRPSARIVARGEPHARDGDVDAQRGGSRSREPRASPWDGDAGRHSHRTRASLRERSRCSCALLSRGARTRQGAARFSGRAVHVRWRLSPSPRHEHLGGRRAARGGGRRAHARVERDPADDGRCRARPRSALEASGRGR